MDYKDVGLFIKSKRLNKRITQQELADELYVDVTTVSKWERGVTFPDNGIVTRLCRTLEINEHELFQACEDRDYRNAKEKLNKISKGKDITFWIISGCYASAILTCFICNLAVNHTLSWFFIVLTACLCGWTFIPTCMKFIKKNRIEWFAGTTFISMVLLFLACSIFTGCYWCFIAMVSVFLGYFAFFFPFIFFKRDWSIKLRKFFCLIYFEMMFVLTIATLAVINSYVSFNLGFALMIASYCFAPVVIASLIRLIPINRFLRASLITFECGGFAIGINGLLNHYLEPSKTNPYKINFADWTNCSDGNTTLIIGICALAASILLLIIGLLKNRVNK